MRRFFTRKFPVKPVGWRPRFPESARQALFETVGFVCRFALGVLLFFVSTNGSVWAWDFASEGNLQYVMNDGGEVVFILRICDSSYGPYAPGSESAGELPPDYIAATVEAAGYWVDVLKPYGQMPGDTETAVLDIFGNPVVSANGTPVVVRGQPVVINVGLDGDAEENAWGDPFTPIPSEKDFTLVTNATALLADKTAVTPVDYGAHAAIGIGTGWVPRSGNQSQVGRGPTDLGPVIIHEFGHVLGIALNLPDSELDLDRWTFLFQFGEQLTRWETHLRDNNGNPSAPNKPIDYDDPEDGLNFIFDMGDPNSETQPARFTFVGKHVLDVFYDSNPDNVRKIGGNPIGVPLQGLLPNDLYYYFGIPEADRWWYNMYNSMAHIDTRSSLMSWQMYRNYPMFIEVELAALQDLGYDVQRRNFFGRSFYVDGDKKTVIYNDAPFWHWNGTGYEVGTPNTSTYGIGAHLFASNLNVVQRGTIRADGAGAAGIRVDGVNNTLTIAPLTTVTANGLNGIGLLAAYGRDHHLIHRGTLMATGSGGMAVRFDFGEPLFGERLGSYAFDPYDNYMDEANFYGGYPEDLQGPLVKAFDITGSITGTKSGQTATYSTGFDTYLDNVADTQEDFGFTEEEIEQWRELADQRVPGDVTDPRNYSWLEPWANSPVSRPFRWGASIYIDDTAAVERINIMSGATISGDILSRRRLDDLGFFWPSVNRNATVEELMTTITFGYKADVNGAATSEIDGNFYFAFKDNINYFRYELHPNILVHQGNGAYVTISPAAEGPLGNDTFWEFTTWDDFFDYDALRIVRPGDGYVYADVVTEGRSATNLHFVGGTTEFLGTTAYVNSVRIDPGATLTLTPAAQPVYSTITIDGVAYNVSRLTDVLKTPEIHIGATFSNLFWEINPPPGPSPGLTNFGRITGDGVFYFGQHTSPNFGGDGYTVTEQVRNSIFVNRGTLAPGPNNGHGERDYFVGTTLIEGRKTGTIAVAGDLDMGSPNSVYEVTITDGRMTSEPYWHIDPITGAQTLLERDIIGGGWGVGDSDRLVVSGTTTLGGTLRVFVTPGDYSLDPTVYTIIQSEEGYTPGRNFENFEHYIGFLTFEPYQLNASKTYISPYDPRDLQFMVIRDDEYFKKHGNTYNERSVATAIDNSMHDSYQIAFSMADNRYKPADLRDMYNQMGAHISANSALMNLWNPSETLFNRIGYGNGQMETGTRGRVDWNRIKGKTAKMLGQTPTRAHRTGSLWFDGLHTSFSAESDYDKNSSNYRFSRTGMMVGAEMNLTRYSSLGGIMAYHLGNTRQTGDKVDSNDYVLGAYFVCAPLNEFEFKAFIGFGFQDYKMERNVYNAAIMADNLYQDTNLYLMQGLMQGGPARYKSDFAGNSFNVSFELARPLELHPTFILRPTLGVDTQYIWQYGATETATRGTDVYALSFQKMTHYRSLFRAGFSSETSGPRGGIRMRAFYVTQFDGENYPVSKARFATGGQPFDVRGVNLGGEFLNLGVGTNVWLDGEKTASLFFDYDSEIYGTKKKTYSHTIQFGYLQNF